MTRPRLWTIAAKVTDVDREMRFLSGIGARLVVDDTIPFEGGRFRAPLLAWGDKFIHLTSKPVYEDHLPRPLDPGLIHVVFEVDDIDAARRSALDAGATEVAPLTRVTAGFGTRDVAFLRSPGGTIFEYIRVLEDKVGRPEDADPARGAGGGHGG